MAGFEIQKGQNIRQSCPQVGCGEVAVPSQLSNVFVEQVHTVVKLKFILSFWIQWKPVRQKKHANGKKILKGYSY